MNKKYDFSQIPVGWRYCFNGDCKKCGECLRYQTGLEIPADCVSGQAVFPTALKDGQCTFFRKDEKVTLATGFLVPSHPMMNEMYLRMRHQLTRYLGGNGTYYLYRNGKKWLSPKQQADIRDIFLKAGYHGEVVFGMTKETYDFT